MGVLMVEWYLLAIGFLLLGLYIMPTIAYRPLRWLSRLAGCLIIGMVLLVLLNWGLGFLDMHVAFNPFTVLVAGILRLPGLVMLVLMNQWFA
jgi:inhibitor of the pro-sigma K processing machinery